MDPLFSDPEIDPTKEQTLEDKDYAEELIGDGKRYKDIQVAARSIVEKDNFIERLKSENAQMRNSLKGEQKIDDFLDKLKNHQVSHQPVEKPSSETPSDGSNPNNQQQKALSLEEVEGLLNRRKEEDNRQRNLQYAAAEAKKAFGANYSHMLREKAQELGVTPEFLTNVAATQPQVFLKLVEADMRETTSNPKTTVNTSAFPKGNNSGLKTQSYYKELRRKIGEAAYQSTKIQNEEMESALQLKQAFFDQ